VQPASNTKNLIRPSNSFLHIGKLLERLYDLPLFVPLWLEARAKAAANEARAQEVAPVQEVQT
jgi:hypothetical protein